MSDKDLKELKRLYDQAVIDDVTVFMFQERTVVTSYAKYLIQYLEWK